MEIRDTLSNAVWYFAGRDAEENSVWESRITGKLNELTYVKSFKSLQDSTTTNRVTKQYEVTADDPQLSEKVIHLGLLTYLRSPTVVTADYYETVTARMDPEETPPEGLKVNPYSDLQVPGFLSVIQPLLHVQICFNLSFIFITAKWNAPAVKWCVCSVSIT